MDKVVFVVEIIWNRSYLWNSVKFKLVLTLHHVRDCVGSSELSLHRAKTFDPRLSWEHLFKYRVRVLSRADYRLHSCTRPVVWGIFAENWSGRKMSIFFIIVCDVWGFFFVSLYSCHFYKSCGLCGALWIFGFVSFEGFFGSYAFRNLTVVGRKRSLVCIIFFYSCWKTEIKEAFWSPSSVFL